MLKIECENGVLRVSDETIREAIDERTRRFAEVDVDMLEAFINAYKVEIGKLMLEKAWIETCIEMAEREISRRETEGG